MECRMECPVEQQDALLVEASTEYVGRWNLLVSTTNWEKGRIISQWRESLRQAGAPAASSTDEAWSQQVGHITPQHVGRLRRVYERFGEVFGQYRGLYWSHFQAACEWPDAEMYLQGAVENDWSVSQMRQQRWEAIGAPADLKPRDAEIITAELDEDAAAADQQQMPAAISESFGEVHGAGDLPDDEPEAEPFDAAESSLPDSALPVANAPAAPPVRPFESLPSLPPDLNEAFELFKLAILAHKVSGWREFACDGVLAVLESLRQLALAPAE
jgi:hypothetical protein